MRKWAQTKEEYDMFEIANIIQAALLQDEASQRSDGDLGRLLLQGAPGIDGARRAASSLPPPSPPHRCAPNHRDTHARAHAQTSLPMTPCASACSPPSPCHLRRCAQPPTHHAPTTTDARSRARADLTAYDALRQRLYALLDRVLFKRNFIWHNQELTPAGGQELVRDVRMVRRRRRW
jgi:hypothetical protein